MLYLTQKVRDPYLLALAHVRVGWVLYLLGELVLAWTHLEQAALYKVETHPHITLGMTNPRLNQPYMKSDFTPQHEKREGAA